MLVALSGVCPNARGQGHPLQLDTTVQRTSGNGCSLLAAGGQVNARVQPTNPDREASQALFYVDLVWTGEETKPDFLSADFLKDRGSVDRGVVHKTCTIHVRVTNQSQRPFQLIFGGIKFQYFWQLEKGEDGHSENAAYVKAVLKERGERATKVLGRLVELGRVASIDAPFGAPFVTTCATHVDFRLQLGLELRGLVGKEASGSVAALPSLYPMNGDVRICDAFF